MTDDQDGADRSRRGPAPRHERAASSSSSRCGCSPSRASSRPPSTRSPPRPASAGARSSATSTPRPRCSGASSTARSRPSAPRSPRCPQTLPVMAAVRQAVVAANHYRRRGRARAAHPHAPDQHRPRAGRQRGHPLRRVGARRSASSSGTALGQPADSLLPLAVGRATLAACRAAYERWAARADADLTVYLDAALRALAAGFDDDVLSAGPAAGPKRPARVTSAQRRRQDSGVPLA